MMKKYRNYTIVVNGVTIEVKVTYIDTINRIVDIVDETVISSPFGEEEVRIEKTLYLNDFKNTLRKILQDNVTNVEFHPEWRGISKICFNGEVYWKENNGR